MSNVDIFMMKLEKMKHLRNISDADIDTLFCDEKVCEKTYDLTDVITASMSPNQKGVLLKEKIEDQCDDVCELFGGPPTKWELFKTSIRLNIIYPIKNWIRKNTINKVAINSDGYSIKYTFILYKIRLFSWIKNKKFNGD